MEEWRDYEEVTVWDYVGLVFMATATSAMAFLLVWTFWL